MCGVLKYFIIFHGSNIDSNPMDGELPGNPSGASATLPTTVSSCFDDRCGRIRRMQKTSQLDLLLRLLVMASEMMGKQDPRYQEHCLAASYIVQQIVQLSLRNVDRAVKEGVPPGERKQAEVEDGGDKKEKKVKEKKSNVKLDKASKNILSSSLEQWALYQLPDKYREYFEVLFEVLFL